MRCIIIDDERIAREGLLEFIQEFDFLECVGTYANALQATEPIRNKEVDLVFLDIEMPRIQGIQFAQLVNNSTTMIVFTTAYPEYALQGYKVNAIDYLLKPIFFEDFSRAVSKAKSTYDLMYPESTAAHMIYFRENGIDHRVLIADIMYIKSLQNYLQVHLTDTRTLIIHQTLKGLLDKLPADKFVQIHRSYVINKDHITAVDGLTVLVKDAPLPIARERKQALTELILGTSARGDDSG